MIVIDLNTDQEVEIDSITFDKGKMFVRWKVFDDKDKFKRYYSATFRTLGDLYERFADA